MRAIMQRQDLVRKLGFKFSGIAATEAVEEVSNGFRLQQQEHGLEQLDLDYTGVVHRLRDCRSLEVAKRLQDYIVKANWQGDRHLANNLVIAYGKCGSVEEAQKIFDGIRDPNVFSWTIMMAAYARNGHHREAIGLFHRMHLEGVEINQVTLTTVLGACCGCLDALQHGKSVHDCIIGSKCELDPKLQTTLLDMYGKNGRVKEARAVFEKMVLRDVIAWSAMITAYAQGGHGLEATRMYQMMSLEGVKPNEITFVALAEACSSFPSLAEREALEEHVLESGLESCTIVGNTLIHMFSKCGDIAAARRAFVRIQDKDVATWSVMISAFTQNEFGDESLLFFKFMLLEGIVPNHATLVNSLDACTSLQKLSDGRLVHSVVISLGFEHSPILATAVLNMYSHCGSLADARDVFEKIPVSSRDVVAWTSMMDAYQQKGLTDKVLELLRCMDLNGVRPNQVTFVTALMGCSSLADAKLLHGSVAGTDFEADVVLGNSLVNFYTKCGSLENAKSVFEEMPVKTVITWNALLNCYQGSEVFELFWRMELEGVRSDETTFVRLLAVCMEASCLAKTRKLHTRIIGEGLESSIVLSNLLISVYGQCGSLNEARRVFEKLHSRNLISWTAIITAYAQHGHSQEALEFYQRMDLEGIKPDDVTFISILFACSHSGMLEEGRRYFLAMVGDQGMEICVKHYDCLVDLLARAGWLDEAEDLLHSAPEAKESSIAWTALLGACKTHNDLKRAERVGKRVAQLDPSSVAQSALLTDIRLQHHLYGSINPKV